MEIEKKAQMEAIKQVIKILTRTICSGKYMVLVGGDAAEVETAVDAVCPAHDYLIDADYPIETYL